jgi:hypothetical protein
VFRVLLASPFFARSRAGNRIVVTGGCLATEFLVWSGLSHVPEPHIIFFCGQILHAPASLTQSARNPLRWSWISGTTVAVKSEIVYHRHFPMEIDCTAILQQISLGRTPPFHLHSSVYLFNSCFQSFICRINQILPTSYSLPSPNIIFIHLFAFLGTFFTASVSFP